MNALIKSLESNLELVTEMAQNQVIEIIKLKEEIAKLQAANDKLNRELQYEVHMKETYRAEFVKNNLKHTEE